MKNLYMMGLGLLFCMQALAQPFSISGRVLDAETQSPLEGVQIQEKGSRNGTFSDSEGKFSLKVSNARSVLLFSYAAYTQQQVALEGKKHLEIQLEPYAITSEEVVVTALGIEQEKKALGYAVQQLSAQELTEVRHTNLTNALAGRMAGVQSTYGASGPGASTHVFIRGETSLSGSNQPLFVLDGVPISNEVISNDTENLEGGFQEVDYGNGAGEISPDDVASITVLKGPAAAALYGSRAANGVVLIKTKDGLASRGLGISFHSSLSLETPVKFPQYQNVYGQGAGGQFAYEDGIGAGINDGGIRSFGPRMEGQLIPQFDSPSTDVNGHALRGGDVIARQGNPITPTPFVPHPDNVRDFFRTGLTLQNHLALSAAQPGGAFRLSYSRLDNEGMVPNADLHRNSLALSGHQALNHRLSMRAFLNYIQSASNHRPAIGYGSENPMYLFTWMGRQVDTRSLKDYWQAGQQGFQQFNYNYLWMDNPYLAVFENTNAFEKNRVLGNVQINLQLTPQLDLRFRTGMDEYSDLRSSRRAKSTQRFKHGAYREDEVHFREINADFQLTYHTLLGKQWRTNFSLGGNWMDQQSAYKSTVAGELSVPGIYNFGNAKIPLVVKQQQAGRRIYSLYGISRLSYGQGLFLDFTFRNDWSSVLPAANRSFAYYSAAAGILLSSFFELPKSIDLLKLRLSSASAGNDTDPFQLKNTFVFNENYATYPLLSSDTRLLNARLKPERLNALETGIELWMFKQRIGLDVSIYQNTSIHQIIRLPTSAASGYTQRVINGGKIRSRGLEAVLNLQPVRNSWNWHLYANFSLNRSRVVQLPGGVQQYVTGVSRVYESTENTVFFIATPTGALAGAGGRMGDMYGTGLKMYRGQHVYDANGFPVRDPNLRLLGNYNPDFMLGFGSRLEWKQLSLDVLFDWRQGGVFVSRTLAIGSTSGVLESTLPGREEGIVGKGVVNIGTPQGPEYVENTRRISATDYYNQFYNRANEANALYDASYLKLRQLSLSCHLPQNWSRQAGLTDVRIGLIARNLFVLTKNPHVDPELTTMQGRNFAFGVEDMAYPASRSMGVDIRLKL